MGEVLTCWQISFDTVHIASGQPCEARFFEDAPYPYMEDSTRVTEFDEKPIVRWLMRCPPSRQIILKSCAYLPTLIIVQRLCRHSTRRVKATST